MSDVGEQLVEVGDVAGLAGVGAGVVQHVHAEPGGAPRDRAPDAPVADDAERRAVHVAAEVLRDRPSPCQRPARRSASAS